jgi:cytochrome c553
MVDIEALTETYQILKQYIPAKDRQEAADNLMSAMTDMLSDQDLKELSGVDSALTRAFKEYASIDEETEYEDE